MPTDDQSIEVAEIADLRNAITALFAARPWAAVKDAQKKAEAVITLYHQQRERIAELTRTNEGWGRRIETLAAQLEQLKQEQSAYLRHSEHVIGGYVEEIKLLTMKSSESAAEVESLRAQLAEAEKEAQSLYEYELGLDKKREPK